MSFYKRIKFLLLLLLILIISFAGYYFLQERSGETIHIAMIGSESEKPGATKAVRLYLDRINSSGGIAGKKIVLDVYDDNNDPKKAVEIAKELAQSGMAVAVIGHDCDACSQQAGAVYQEEKIPAITPFSKGIGVVEKNPWYFRNIFENRSQAKFLAYYVENVLLPKSVIVIHDDLKENAQMAELFANAALKLEMEVPIVRKFSNKSPDLEINLEVIADDLFKNASDTQPIFLATRVAEGSKLIKLLKDKGLSNPILTTDRFSIPNIRDYFRHYPKEKIHPGYYMDGVYVVTPLIYDLANVQAQQLAEEYERSYGKEAHWYHAYAYDSAKVILEAIKNTEVQGDKKSIHEDRKKIGEYLKQLTHVVDAVVGTTGFNCFDDQGNSKKPVTIGIYKGIHFLPALYQFQTIQDIKEINTLEEDLEERRIMKFGANYLHKTSVIHTGINIQEISQLDINNLVFKMDFELWFRYHQGEIDIGNIEFLNALKPVRLRTPTSEEIMNQIVYRRYQISGLFKADFLPNYEFAQHVLGVSFRHKKLTRNELIYVKDVLGMIEPNPNDLQQNSRILSPIYGWTIKESRSFQDISKKKTKGSLKYINHKEKTVEHSRFTSRLSIAKSAFTIRRSLPSEHVNILFLINSLLILILMVIGNNKQLHFFTRKTIRYKLKKRSPVKRKVGFSYFESKTSGRRPDNRDVRSRRKRMLHSLLKVRFLLRMVFNFMFLLLSESFLLHMLLDRVNDYHLDTVILLFDILWWLVPAKVVADAIDRYVFDPIEEKTERNVPALIRNSSSFLIHLFAIFGVIAFVFDFKLTSLLATSGVFMMIIGLAIQLNISNIFSGLAINIEHPYRIGDWVEITGYPDGRVLDINWRTTRIETRNGCMLCIPNSTAAESAIHNYSLPTELFYWKNVVHLDAGQDPSSIRKILLNAVMDVDQRILKTPTPKVTYAEVTEDNAVYWVIWASKNFEDKYLARQEVALSIWKHLKRSGIHWAKRSQDLYLHQQEESKEFQSPTIDPLKILEEVILFESFSSQDMNYISQKMKLHSYQPGEYVIRQGEEGDSLFIVVEGIVGVTITLENSDKLEVARLGAGKFFGEMALLTGEPRSADVIAINESLLFEITKDDIAPMILKEPELSTKLSDILTERKLDTQNQSDQAEDKPETRKSVSQQILNKIHKFFGIGKKQ